MPHCGLLALKGASVPENKKGKDCKWAERKKEKNHNLSVLARGKRTWRSERYRAPAAETFDGGTLESSCSTVICAMSRCASNSVWGKFARRLS